MTLSKLGPYRIERTEDYDQCPEGDKSYCEIVRVRGSKIEAPAYMMPSHLYKFSETELGLYMKDKKNLWRNLGKLLNEDIDISDNEILLKFPVSKFKDVAMHIPLVKKRGQINLSEDQKKERVKRLNIGVKPASKIEQKEPNSEISDPSQAITLDTFGSE